MEIINLAIDEKMLADFDDFCKQNGYNRSEAIRAAMRQMMGKSPFAIHQ